ncbi:glycosyltransferase family 4 protein [Candidatus Latescibacterota bacterium]
MSPTDHLMVFICDRLSDLVRKGEVLPRYYNPGDVFDKVTIVVSNWREDEVAEADVQPMAGRAQLQIVQHTLPNPVTTFGWRFVEKWLESGVRELKPMEPTLIWALGCFQHGQLAARVAQSLGSPMVVSLHGRWDVDEKMSLPRWAYAKLRVKAEEETLQTADLVIAVYSDIEPYARMRGARRVETVYNSLNAEALTPKSNYELATPPRLLSINRQVRQKDSSNILRAIAEYDIDCDLEIIGNGPIHGDLVRLAGRLGIEERVHFVQARQNEEICRSFCKYDLFVATCHYHGISKGTLEAGYAGLPIILNQRRPEPVSELGEDWMFVVEDSVAGYGQAMLAALSDPELRRAKGTAARQRVREEFRPQEGEAIRAARFEALARGDSEIEAS